ncbi:MAG TPA: ornithine cyclodeaminase family protein [Gemmatimonas sp.]|uniref:ornithine cyclodeaminase family protein n=1 Tax=Gemmatimonas sp. TaxID=1962908 RepID=UPI002EDAE720
MAHDFSADRKLLPQCTADQIHALLNWDALAAALTEAFLAPPAVPTRHAHALMAPGASEPANDVLLLMPAWNAQHIGIKLVTVLPEAAKHGGHTVDASYLLLDRLTGAPRLLLDGESLTVRRTAATSAVAARALARPDADTLLVVGTGRLAAWMARAHVALRPTLRRVLVWGRRRESAEQLADTLRAEWLGAEWLDAGSTITVQAIDSLEQGCSEAQIISCATTASEPVVRGAWLTPGTHIDLVGAFTPAMREVDDEAVLRAVLVVDDYAAALREAGDVLQPLANGTIARDHLQADLREVLQGVHPGRRHADDITMFKSVGHALEDLAAASLVFDRLASQ